MDQTRSAKRKELVEWVEEALLEHGPTKIEVLHFGTKSKFYMEGSLWFRDVVEGSDRFSIDPENRVHLNEDYDYASDNC